MLKNFRLLLLTALAAGGLCACSPDAEETDRADTRPDPKSATLAFEAEPLDANRIRFVIDTTIPTPVEVMASVSLAGQAPKDVWVGYNERVRLDGPRTTLVLDTSTAHNPLPTGEYEAEVAFYPDWGAENGNPAAREVDEIEITHTIALKGSGEDRSVAERRNELQRWVMSNLGMNVPWNRASYEAKLGPAQMGPSTMSRLHDAYYFPEADVTLLVNRVRNEVTVWRLGDKTE